MCLLGITLRGHTLQISSIKDAEIRLHMIKGGLNELLIQRSS